MPLEISDLYKILAKNSIWFIYIHDKGKTTCRLQTRYNKKMIEVSGYSTASNIKTRIEQSMFRAIIKLPKKMRVIF